MEVVCKGPWRAGALLWQPRAGDWALTVACHAIFELAPGDSPIIPRPLSYPADGDHDERWLVEPWGPVAPLKPRPEVIVVGHAYAPPGCRVTSLLARLAVGDLEKVVRVHGDSYFTRDGSLLGPEPFTRMPLRWERAAGGPHTTNPAGVRTGPDVLPDELGRVFLPNLRPHTSSMATRDQLLEPVGFGPLAPSAPARLQRLRRHAAIWDAASWAERPLPEDLDVSYFNVAPPDQLLGELTGMQRLVLEHLHPRFPRLATYLRAPAAPHARASLDGIEQPVPLHRDTLVIDTDRGLAVVVWRGRLTFDAPPGAGIVTISAISPDGDETLPPEGDGMPTWEPPLPFAPAAAAPRGDPSSPSSRGAAATDAAGTRAFGLGLGTKTLQGEPKAPRKPALPFSPAPESPAPEPPAPESEAADAEPPTLRRGMMLAAAMRAAAAEPSLERPSPPSPPSPPEPPSPATIPSTRPEPAAAPRSEPSPARPSPPPRPPPRRTVASSVEHCGAVAARLAQRRAEGAAILEQEELTLEGWRSEHARWQGEIQAEIRRGRKKLISAYDAGYVAALEEERGPIAATEYARLSIAAERGEGGAKLAELGLPDDAMPRLRRVWLARIVKDPRLAAEVRAATRAAAEE